MRHLVHLLQASKQARNAGAHRPPNPLPSPLHSHLQRTPSRPEENVQLPRNPHAYNPGQNFRFRPPNQTPSQTSHHLPMSCPGPFRPSPSEHITFDVLIITGVFVDVHNKFQASVLTSRGSPLLLRVDVLLRVFDFDHILK